jgi:hypothetical protein
MNRRFLSAAGVVTTILAMTACEQTKSSNPLSPAVAGPIPGVNISAPKMLEPSANAKIATDKQPITLLIENASTTGVRPLTYVFEIATDLNFNTKVFTREAIAGGDAGRTSLRLPDPLQSGRNYFWRARAEDGANTGPYSATMGFDVFTPIVIDVPGLLSPAPNAIISTVRPRFTFTNAPRSGPAGPITYLVEVADNDAFSNKVTGTVAEQPNQTSFDPPVDGAYAKVYYWHVRAYDPTTVGPWSPTFAFMTPPAPVVVAPPSAPVPTPSGPPAANDAINFGQAIILNSPRDLGSWPVTTSITRLDIRSSGVHVEFSKKDGPGRWPDFTPAGWNGPLQYTLGMALNINGSWYASAPVEFWYGLDRSGGPPSQYALNWFYDPARWAPMTYHQPAVGEMIGYFVCAGDCRNRSDSSGSPVRERSNVVLVPMPSDAGATHTFSGPRIQ